MNADVCDKGEPPLSLRGECQSFHDRRLAQRSLDAERLGVPLFLSEFGACYDSENCEMEVGLVADACDDHLVGWAYWQFKNYWDLTTSAGNKTEGFYNRDGSLSDHKLNAITRTYMPYTQGILKSHKFDTVTNSFKASFIANHDIASPSVLYASQDYHYKGQVVAPLFKANGAVIDSAFKVTREGPYVMFQLDDAKYHNQLIDVSITADGVALE
jgi:hypothetical protein